MRASRQQRGRQQRGQRKYYQRLDQRQGRWQLRLPGQGLQPGRLRRVFGDPDGGDLGATRYELGGGELRRDQDELLLDAKWGVQFGLDGAGALLQCGGLFGMDGLCQRSQAVGEME